jgi:hypothetical protein
MRWNDFKLVESKKLYEAANAGLETQHTLHDINAIKTAIPNIPNEKAEEKVELLGQIKKLNNAIKSFIDRVSPKKVDQSQAQQRAPEPQVEPARQTNDPNATVEEAKANPNVQKKLYSIKDIERTDAEIEQELNDLLDSIKFVETLEIADEAKKQEALKRFNKNLDGITKKFETVRAQRDSARAERDEAIKFIKDVTGILVTLGNKVQGYQEATEEDLASMSSRTRTSVKKAAVNAEKFTKTLKQALFGKILDMQEGSDVTQDEIKDFLKACADGKVINMLGVIGTDRGNIKDHVNPEYQKVFDVFVEENIFSYSPGTTSGAIGPGEMALSMMGNPAEKGKKGDLKIGDKEVEIKASAKTGGRLNSKSITKATSGWQVWKQRINDILKDAPKDRTIGVTNKKGQVEQLPINKFDGNQYNVIKDKVKLGSKYNFNVKGINALNAEVLQPYSNFEKTFTLFHDTFKSLVLNFDKIKMADKLIANAIEQDGTVDFQKIGRAYTKIAYESYHIADGITTIMFLRTDSLDYTIAEDGDDLVKKMQDGTIIMGAGFNWNDDQQTPTPGYTASKA